jgi:hypothetical protein
VKAVPVSLLMGGIEEGIQRPQADVVQLRAIRAVAEGPMPPASAASMAAAGMVLLLGRDTMPSAL